MRIVVRPFDGSLADAEGLLAVERATFNESPYGAGQAQAMLTEGPQRAWLALSGEKVVGFVVAFPTHGLGGTSWEIDLLAVHPDWRGRGLATRLVQAAGACGAAVADRARAVTAADNTASVRAFVRAGFRPRPQTCQFLISRTAGLRPSSRTYSGLVVQETTRIAEAVDWLVDPPSAEDHPGLTLLLARREGRPAGYAELIEVQTLLYRGVWIESLVASELAVRQALVQQATDRAVTAGSEEIGAIVPASNWPLRQALLAAGFRSLGDFCWLTAELPLPGAMRHGDV